MKFFPAGISITDAELKCLLHMEEDPEAWLQEALKEKARLRRDALVKEWLPRLLRDTAVVSMSADPGTLAASIIGRPDYKTRAQHDIDVGRVESTHQRDKFDGRGGRGPRPRTFMPGGLDLDNDEVACILSYVQSIEEWITGALAGNINRGRKKLITEYMPVLFADPKVVDLPGDEDDLIDLITGRPDYVTFVSRR